MDRLDIGRLAWLSRNELLTGGATQRLAATLGSIEALFSAEPDELVAGGASEVQLARFLRLRHQANPEGEAERIYKEGQTPIPWTDGRYPVALQPTNDPPPILFVRGEPALLAAMPAVAVVGTRECTEYGAAVTKVLTTTLTRHGATIVSGLALGIDGDAHTACLDAGGRTLAVLGTGIDDATLYPAEHRALAARILASGGAIVSEYPPGVGRTAYRFPRRNRIVAALAQATVVVEAPITSGALITARLAAELGREVFAVPGPVTAPTSFGCNRLIADGAAPVVTAETVLEALGLKVIQEKLALFFPPDEVVPQGKRVRGTRMDPRLRGDGSTAGAMARNARETHPHDTTASAPLPDLSALSDFERTVHDLHVTQRLHPDIVAEKTARAIVDVLTAITTLEVHGLTTAR
jgi:DNA protecting protein DprA